MEIEAFCSYDWGENNTNQIKVKRIVETLKNKFSHSVWIDESQLRGGLDLADKITDGLKRCKCFILFLTKNYHNKVNSGDTSDFCRFEFNAALHLKMPLLMVVLDRNMCGKSNWELPFAAYVGNPFYLDFTDPNIFSIDELSEDSLFYKKCALLHSCISSIISGQSIMINDIEDDSTDVSIHNDACACNFAHNKDFVYFDETHQMFLCALCFTLKHKQCDCFHIAEEKQKIEKEYHEKYDHSFQQILKKVEEIEKDVELTIEKLKFSYDSSRNLIAEKFVKAQYTLALRENYLTNSLEQLYSSKTLSLDKQKRYLQTISKNLKKKFDQVTNLQLDHNSQKYITKGLQLISEIKKFDEPSIRDSLVLCENSKMSCYFSEHLEASLSSSILNTGLILSYSQEHEHMLVLHEIKEFLGINEIYYDCSYEENIIPLIAFINPSGSNILISSDHDQLNSKFIQLFLITYLENLLGSLKIALNDPLNKAFFVKGFTSKTFRIKPLNTNANSDAFSGQFLNDGSFVIFYSFIKERWRLDSNDIRLIDPTRSEIIVESIPVDRDLPYRGHLFSNRKFDPHWTVSFWVWMSDLSTVDRSCFVAEDVASFTTKKEKRTISITNPANSTGILVQEIFLNRVADKTSITKNSILLDDPANLQLNQWLHVAVTRSNSNLVAFINGNPFQSLALKKDSEPISGTEHWNKQEYLIPREGCDRLRVAHFWIFPLASTQVEIGQLYSLHQSQMNSTFL